MEAFLSGQGFELRRFLLMTLFSPLEIGSNEAMKPFD